MGQDDIKVYLGRAVNTICDRLGQYAYQESSQDMISLLKDLPEKVELCTQKLKNDICKSFSKEMQGITSANRYLTKSSFPPSICQSSLSTLPDSNSVLSSSVQASQIKVVEAVQACKMTNARGEIKYPIKPMVNTSLAVYTSLHEDEETRASKKRSSFGREETQALAVNKHVGNIQQLLYSL